VVVARVSGVPLAEALAQGLDGRVAQRRRARGRYANITIIEGNEASQFGIGIVSARIAEAVLRDERAVLPIGAYNAGYGVTLSLPSVVGAKASAASSSRRCRTRNGLPRPKRRGASPSLQRITS